MKVKSTSLIVTIFLFFITTDVDTHILIRVSVIFIHV